ncbi:hypothetical protein AAVH_26498 [Aphelenchoides avenae]|nr:hypothetical protein AAVH_26498 [Aphelenchus avenae]
MPREVIRERGVRTPVVPNDAQQWIEDASKPERYPHLGIAANTPEQRRLTALWLKLPWPVRKALRLLFLLAKFLFKRVIIIPLLALSAPFIAKYAFDTRDYWFAPVKNVTIFLWRYVKGFVWHIRQGAVAIRMPEPSDNVGTSTPYSGGR